MLFEDSNFLSEDSKDFINDQILTNEFPFYMNDHAVPGDNVKNMMHVVLPRIEDRDKTYRENKFLNEFVKILNEFCNKNKLRYNEILRIAVNLTYYNGVKDMSPTHCDHEFEHNQLLIYLNDPLDKDSCTVIINEQGSEIKIKPEKYKGVCFSRMPHYASFPKIGERYVLVFTFR